MASVLDKPLHIVYTLRAFCCGIIVAVNKPLSRRECSLIRRAIVQRQILRLKDVVELVGLSKTTIWRRMRAGEFPSALRLGGPSTRAVGWKMTDVEAWLEQRRATLGRN